MLEFSTMLLLAASAFLCTLLGYVAALKLFPKLGLLDFPERYGLKRPRLPYPTGSVAVVVFLLLFLSTQEIGSKEIGVIAAISLLAVTSFIDDRTPLPSALRLALHIVAAIIVFAVGARIYTITNPLGGILDLDNIVLTLGSYGTFPILGGLFTIAWLLLTTNALNWFDGIPGQVNVISVIGFAMLGCLAYFRNGEAEIAEIAFILAAIGAAGIVFDFPPAKMLMGDTGSMFFGFMLGLLGVYQGGKVATAFLALGLPLLDAAFVIIRRILRGDSPLKGGRDHLHHLLLDRGWSPRQVILLTAMVGTAFGASALFMDTRQKFIAAIVLAVLTLGLTYVSGRKYQKPKTKDQNVW